MRDLILLLCAAVAYTAGGVCMKYSAGLTSWRPSVLLYVLFAAGATLQALAMRRSELGVSYLFVLGLEAVLAFGLGHVIFSEPATPVRILAVVMVTAGILLLRG